MIAKKMRLTVIMLLTSLIFGNLTFAQEGSGELVKRENIDPKYTWNLKDIYENEDQWNADFKWLDNQVKNYKQFEGKIGESSQNLLNVIKFEEQVGIKFGKIRLYASLAKDLDLTNSHYQAMYDRTMTLASNLSSASSFVDPEILAIPEADLWKFVDEQPELKVYKHSFEELLRTKAHTLSKELENVMALAQPVRSVPYDAFGMYKNADIDYPSVADDKGNQIKLSDGRYYAALYSPDREYRKRAYKGYYVPVMDHRNMLNALFNGNIKSNIFNAKVRNYNSTREAALDNNNIPVSVYDNLVNSVNDNLNALHRWAALKKKILKVDELHPYDTYVTLFPAVIKKYTYDEGVKMTLDALKPLGADYISSLNKAFDNRWIDVYETKAKRSGAYSSGTTFGIHPYVLLNWNDQLNDVFTLAHEMGHNMHSFYTGLNQPYPYADYSIFVAEVASTMNEALLLDYLIDKADTKEEKLALIEKQLNNITFTFYRQTRFAEFEQLVNELTEKGEALTADKLCEIYGEMYQRYWGPDMKVDEEETYTWARIPHFYYNFYVYQYATSFAASQHLAAKVESEGQEAIDKYLNFLKAGSSVYPIDVLEYAGVDMNSPEAIQAVSAKMDQLLDQMEELLSEN